MTWCPGAGRVVIRSAGDRAGGSPGAPVPTARTVAVGNEIAPGRARGGGATGDARERDRERDQLQGSGVAGRPAQLARLRVLGWVMPWGIWPDGLWPSPLDPLEPLEPFDELPWPLWAPGPRRPLWPPVDGPLEPEP